MSRMVKSGGRRARRVFSEEFRAGAVRLGDTTEFVIGSSGKLYLAVVLDLFSRFVVGWAVSAINDRHLALGPSRRHRPRA